MESLNDYLFALSSHAVYWDSQDCILFLLNQIFSNASPAGSHCPGTPTTTKRQNPHQVTADAVTAGLLMRGQGGTLTRNTSAQQNLGLPPTAAAAAAAFGMQSSSLLQPSASTPMFGQTFATSAMPPQQCELFGPST